MYTNVKSTFICTSQNLKSVQMSMNRWINKLWYIQRKYSLAIKSNNLLVLATTWILLKILILSKKKKNRVKKYILSNLIYIKFYHTVIELIHSDSKQISLHGYLIIILTVVINLQVYRYVQTFQIVQFKYMYSLMYVNFILIKLFKKKS